MGEDDKLESEAHKAVTSVSRREVYIDTKRELIEFMCDVAWEISIAAVGLRGFPLRPLPNVYRAVASGRVV